VTWHGQTLGTIEGVDNVTGMLRGFIGALPDLHTAVQDIVAAGEQAFQRMYARTQDRDQPTTWTTRQAQYDAVCAWGSPIMRGCHRGFRDFGTPADPRSAQHAATWSA
jgi:hypothetical protein